ncbi:hypothetical protein B296_00011195 [Ensete ventricosum]|uniref:Uncharacterized protein n=1 Tax=Ensete ventricosum TaxID=4639 RepID=A0A427B509_ENSVE|nr:hypothetical protein B296_00011195 [Ensete ventricosum]
MKDMNEAWLAEAGLSLAPRGMFLLSAHCLCEMKDRVGAERYFATIVTRLKVAKGEDPLMLRWSAIAGSSQFWTEGSLSGKYLCGALHPTLAKQAYECSSEELMNRASKSAIWVNSLSSIPFVFFPPFCLSFLSSFSSHGLYFITALIDRVHDASRLVRSQHEIILALRATDKELKG